MSVFKTVNPRQASELLAQGNVQIIDVREPHEWMDGHLSGAELVPLARFRTNPKAALTATVVLFVCAAGVRSEAAARLAVSTGGATQVYNLAGGTRAWARAGLPLESARRSARRAQASGRRGVSVTCAADDGLPAWMRRRARRESVDVPSRVL